MFGYNRPDHLRRTLEALAAADGASDSDLHLFCDGPKTEAGLEQVEAVHAVARSMEWAARFRSVSVEASATNKGLAASIVGGVSKVVEVAGRAIILEDDLIVSSDFLRFMNDCLDFYQDDQKVGSVTGFSPLSRPPAGYPHDVMAVPRNSSQGWGIWADRWRLVDWDASGAARLWRDPALRRRFNSAGNDRLGRLRRQLQGRNQSWSIRFGLWQVLSGRHTIYPVQNRVRNIGYDGSGVHTRQGENVNAAELSQVRPYLLEHVGEDRDVLRAVARIYGGAWPRRWLRELKTWVQPAAMP